MNAEDYSASDDALDKAGVLAKVLSTSVPMPLREQDAVLLEDAAQFSFGPQNSRPAWSFGTGPVVLLVHGYSGRGIQMAQLARTISRHGFRAVIFDAGGHGSARQEKIGFDTFIEDTAAIASHIGKPLFAMIGHSAGGLAMMRARAIHGVRAQRYAVIAAPYYPYVPLDNMIKRGAPRSVLPYVKAILSDQFRATWTELAGGISFLPEEGKPLLAIYDESDDRVHATDAEKISALWPNTKVVRTLGYGHNKLLQSKETLEATTDFLLETVTTSAAQSLRDQSPERAG
jgi:pimeloyl-ACP methyl ester carboxylesterase